MTIIIDTVLTSRLFCREQMALFRTSLFLALSVHAGFLVASASAQEGKSTQPRKGTTQGVLNRMAIEVIRKRVCKRFHSLPSLLLLLLQFRLQRSRRHGELLLS